MCHEERDSDDPSVAKEASLDFIPTVDVYFWPDEALDWYLKRRPKVRDKRTDTIYQWPSSEIVSQAQQIGCNLVPVGFVEPKQGKLSQVKEERDSPIKKSFYK